jgi:hypothetical protein
MAVINGFDNSSIVRKCVLISEPYIDEPSGLNYIKSQDVHGSQYNICLNYLPPGITISQIHQGQTWWIEKRTTLWTIFASVNEIISSCYSLFYGEGTQTFESNWEPLIFGTANTVIESSFGAVTSDPTTGAISVPNPGIYDVNLVAYIENNYPNVRIRQPNSIAPFPGGGTDFLYYGPTFSAMSSNQMTATLACNENNMTFFIEMTASPYGTISYGTQSSLVVSYKGPMI